MKRTSSIPWWLWPNVLNLDAPVVAVAWLELFARLVDMELSVGARALLFLSVWEVYFADHWLDGKQAPADGASARHAFHKLRTRVMMVPGLAAVPAILVLAWKELAASGWAVAGVLSLATFIHFLQTHGVSSGKRRLPKELVVGFIFASGTILLPATQNHFFDSRLFLPGTVFGVLCVLNCCFVTLWEKLPGDAVNPDSLQNRFPHFAEKLMPLTFALGMIALLLMALDSSSDFKLFYGAVAATTVGFLWLHRVRNCWSGAFLRVLADAVMLTPGFALLIGRFCQ